MIKIISLERINAELQEKLLADKQYDSALVTQMAYLEHSSPDKRIKSYKDENYLMQHERQAIWVRDSRETDDTAIFGNK